MRLRSVLALAFLILLAVQVLGKPHWYHAYGSTATGSMIYFPSHASGLSLCTSADTFPNGVLKNASPTYVTIAIVSGGGPVLMTLYSSDFPADSARVTLRSNVYRFENGALDSLLFISFNSGLDTVQIEAAWK